MCSCLPWYCASIDIVRGCGLVNSMVWPARLVYDYACVCVCVCVQESAITRVQLQECNLGHNCTPLLWHFTIEKITLYYYIQKNLSVFHS